MTAAVVGVAALVVATIGLLLACIWAEFAPSIRRWYWRVVFRVGVELYAVGWLSEQTMHAIGERRYRAFIDDHEAW